MISRCLQYWPRVLAIAVTLQVGEEGGERDECLEAVVEPHEPRLGG